MSEKKETFTRAEVEALLKQLNDENIQVVRDHFQEDRRLAGDVLKLAAIAVSILALVFIFTWVFA